MGNDFQSLVKPLRRPNVKAKIYEVGSCLQRFEFENWYRLPEIKIVALLKMIALRTAVTPTCGIKGRTYMRGRPVS